MKAKLNEGDGSAVVAVEKVKGTLDARIDLDKIWRTLSEPMSFSSMQKCERKVIEMTELLKSIVAAHEKAKDIAQAKMDAGEKLRRPARCAARLPHLPDG